MRRARLMVMFLASLIPLCVGILFTREHDEWLHARGLVRLVVSLLVSYGLAAVFTLLIIRSKETGLDRRSFIVSYLRVFALVFATLAGIIILFTLFGYVISLTTAYPLIAFPALFLLLPLVLIIIDMFQGKARKTPRNLLFGYGQYAYPILYLLLAQLILIPILFFMGPMGLFFIFISIVDLVSRLLPSIESNPLPILCHWGGIGQPACGPSLLLLLLFYLLLFLIAARFGNSIAAGLSSGFHWGKDKLGSFIETDDTN